MDADRTARLGSSSDADAGHVGAGGSEDGEALARSFLGKKLGEFRVLREIGRGSMGIVFEAEQGGLKRRVAVKVLPPSLSVTKTVIQRFLREAQSIAKLSHENIVQVYEVGESEDVNWYAMQFIEGKSLDRALKERKFPPQDCARIIGASARALFYAHEHGIIHRDIKPANLILTYKDKPVITDFGLARPEKAATLTESGALVGTPIYMSPEQVRGDRVHIDRRTDIYSLGVTLYEMLTGSIPFEATSTQEILRKIESEEPRPVRKLAPHVPKAIATICHKAMEKELGRRYQTAIELALDLERFLGGEAIQARPTSLSTRVIRRARRHKLIAGLIAAALFFGAFAITNYATGKKAGVERDAIRFDTLFADGLAVQRKDPSRALLKFTEAIGLNPESQTAYLERGKTFWWTARIEDALRDFSQALVLDPNFGAAHAWHGIASMQEGTPEEFAKGASELKDALDQYPDDPEVLKMATNKLIGYARKSGRAQRDEIMKSCNQWIQHVLELVPNDDEALVLQGNLYEEDGVFYRDPNLVDLAYANYEKARKINGNNIAALNLLTRDRKALIPSRSDGKNPQAPAASSWLITLASQGLTWAKDKVEVPTDLMSRTANLFVPKSATASEPTLEGIDLEKLEALLAKADAAWTEENFDESIKLYEAALAMHPNTLEAHQRIAEYCLRSGKEDLPRARKSIDKALASAPSNLRTLMYAFRVYSAQNDPEKVKEVIGLATKYHPAMLTIPVVQDFLRAQGMGAEGQPAKPADAPPADGKKNL